VWNDASEVTPGQDPELGPLLWPALADWGLAPDEEARLLAISPEQLKDLKQGAQTLPSGEPLERAACLVDLHIALWRLFPENPDLRSTWIKRRNKVFADSKPLDVMLEGLEGLKHVARTASYQAHT
jgi:hypothetical protein